MPSGLKGEVTIVVFCVMVIRRSVGMAPGPRAQRIQHPVSKGRQRRRRPVVFRRRVGRGGCGRGGGIRPMILRGFERAANRKNAAQNILAPAVAPSPVRHDLNRNPQAATSQVIAIPHRRFE